MIANSTINNLNRKLPKVLVLICFVYTSAVSAQSAEQKSYLRQDVREILVKDIDLDPCSQCHQSEFKVWKKSAHATGFNELHKKAAAQRIVKKMGFSLVKRESLCMKCHYTPNIKNDKLIAVAGVSCESCHGEAKGWETLHSDFGIAGSDGFGEKKAQESAGHRQQRLAATEQAGMLRPGDIYDVVANCFECHTVPHERLVNIGGHSTGSQGFHLPEKIEKIRHNFLQSFLFSDGTENAKNPPARKRLLYITGRALDLEYNLRGAAEATEEGDYFENMVNRIGDAVAELELVSERIKILQVEKMINTYKTATVSLNNRAGLLQAAKNVQSQAKDILREYDGSTFSKLDSLIAGQKDKVSRRLELQLQVSHQPTAQAGENAATGGVQNPYPVKPKIRPGSKFATIGPRGCNCHDTQVDWLKNNFHNTSLQPFQILDDKVLRIAVNYGIAIENITKGTSLCMDCHSTVITGKEFREVRNAVSCESCHGPGKDYKKPHQDEDRGYEISAGFGMKQLEQANVRAANCAECHYITDKRLLASGHPSGKDFDLARGNDRVKHWEGPKLSSSSLNSAYKTVAAGRGQIPVVDIVNIYNPNKLTQISQLRAAKSRALSAIREKVSPWSSRSSNIELSEFPEIDPNASVEEILLILKNRLEEIYEKSAK
ncbi:MAG: cytochrome c family protein [Calditrichia bacterium]